MTAAVCFDLDDTLYDYHQYARTGLEAAADYLEAHTGRRLHEELVKLYFEEDVREGTFDRLVEGHDLPDGIVEALVEAYHSASAPLTPYPETEAVLDALSGSHRLGLITDGRGGHRKLQRLGLREHFDTVVVTPTIGASKHDLEPFERSLSELSVRPETAVYVGDDPRVDFRVPNEMGLRTVRIRRGRYTDLEPTADRSAPDHEIESLDELSGLLEREE